MTRSRAIAAGTTRTLYAHTRCVCSALRHRMGTHTSRTRALLPACSSATSLAATLAFACTGFAGAAFGCTYISLQRTSVLRVLVLSVRVHVRFCSACLVFFSVLGSCAMVRFGPSLMPAPPTTRTSTPTAYTTFPYRAFHHGGLALPCAWFGSVVAAARNVVLPAWRLVRGMAPACACTAGLQARTNCSLLPALCQLP